MARTPVGRRRAGAWSKEQNLKAAIPGFSSPPATSLNMEARTVEIYGYCTMNIKFVRSSFDSTTILSMFIGNEKAAEKVATRCCAARPPTLLLLATLSFRVRIAQGGVQRVVG